MKPDRIDLIEIFSSIQGEGVHIGRRQLFIRLCGCNLCCAYCDTPAEPCGFCRVETDPERGEISPIPNPVSHDQLVDIVSRMVLSSPHLHHAISITGGEPLCQTERLLPLLPRLSALLPLLLETNGTLPDRLLQTIDHLSVVSMDLKLASTTGVETHWELHERFLEIASRKEVYVKLVVNALTTPREVERGAELLQRHSPASPLILQPESTPRDDRRIGGRALLMLQRIAAAIHPDVRVIPQTHRIIGVA
ncbi:MAG: 7-carboxy-7-deazaguanine synthase QueE [Desulfuromonadia bacterium]